MADQFDPNMAYEAAPKTSSGFDPEAPYEAAAAPKTTPGGAGGSWAPKGYMERAEGAVKGAADWAMRPLLPKGESVKAAEEYASSVPTLEESQHPIWTATKKGLAGSYGSGMETARQFVNPLTIATAGVGGLAEGAAEALPTVAKAMKPIGAAAGLGLATLAGKQAVEGAQEVAKKGLTPETAERTLQPASMVPLGLAGALQGTRLGTIAGPKEVATAPVRVAAKGYNIAREVAPVAMPIIGAVEGGMRGGPVGAAMGGAGGVWAGHRLKSFVPEASETFGLPPEEANVRSLQKRYDAAQKEAVAAAKEVNGYKASMEAGVEPPADVMKRHVEAQRALGEAQFHLEQTVEAAKPKPAARTEPFANKPLVDTTPAGDQTARQERVMRGIEQQVAPEVTQPEQPAQTAPTMRETPMPEGKVGKKTMSQSAALGGGREMMQSSPLGRINVPEPTRAEAGVEKPGEPVVPFKSTEGAMDTIKRDLEAKGLAATGAKPEATYEQRLKEATAQAERSGEAVTIKDEVGKDVTIQPEGTTAPEVRTIKAAHYSSQEGLETLDPTKQGTGMAGAETKRSKEPGYLPRTYLGVEGEYKEPRITQQANKYPVELDASKIYDADSDTEGLFKNATADGKNTAPTNAEQAVKNAGYQGYRRGGVVASFEPIKLTPKAEGAPLDYEALSAANKGGGFTHNPTKGDLEGKPLYSVAGEPATRSLEKVIAGHDATAEDIKAFRENPKVASALKEDPSRSVGGWKDGNGDTHLEVSKSFTDHDIAVKAGKDWNQQYVRDHANRDNIATGGTGEASKTTHTMSEDEKADFESHVNNTTPMGPTPLNALREFAEANTDQSVKYLSAGTQASLYDLGNGNVMRVGEGEVPKTPDIPEALKPIDSTEVAGSSGNKYHAMIMPKMETTGITAADVKAMTKTLADKGYTWDAGEYNLGKDPNGKLVVIDPGAIQPAEAKVAPTSEDWKARGFTDPKQMSQVSNQLGHPDNLEEFANKAKGREAATKLGNMKNDELTAYAASEYGTTGESFSAQGGVGKGAKKAFVEKLLSDKSPEDVLKDIKEQSWKMIDQEQHLRPNASAESDQSLENINRGISRDAKGLKMYRVDTRSGKATPVLKADVADAEPNQGEALVDYNTKTGEYEVTKSGPGARVTDKSIEAIQKANPSVRKIRK